MHRLKAHIRVLALCACALLASCVRPTETNFRKTATPRADEYSRLLIRQMLARDTTAMRRKFSPALLQIPHAADSLAAFARYFPGGVKQVKLVGVNAQWTSYVTTRVLTYEARSKDDKYAVIQVQTLEDELHNLYVNGFYVQQLEGPIPQPAPLIPMPGAPWWIIGILLLGGGIFAITQMFKKRPSRDPRDVPLFPATPRKGAPPAPVARPRPDAQPQHTPEAMSYVAPALVLNQAADATTARLEPAGQADAECAPLADSDGSFNPLTRCEPGSGLADSATAESESSTGAGFDSSPDSSHGTGSDASYDSGTSSSYDSGSDVRFD
ncbi:hypothetical protein [Longimicrobium terrae]|uniref:Uncharacterized protein n=1 Tax=Longimicrobium terrae TaxID=1639882 RepID=A0A841GTV4_9BACT|nr:hypothetical protein [Longimicrobium terrae]MBB4635685.1 hypothetical protein [Longimicrobium terrae]MBB6070079.1 hypothetical protein [Longimicrobium terrae]NNC32982.1 hypothetical protein [Longimicrobium terrae]